MKRFRKITATLTIAACIALSGCGEKTTEAVSVTTEATTEAATESDATTEAEVATSEASNDKADVATAGDMTDVEAVGYEGMEAIYADALNDGEYEIEVDCSSSMFKIKECVLTVKDGKLTAELKMNGSGYTHVYPGTGEEAAAADEADLIPAVTIDDESYSFTIPVEALDHVEKCAAFSKRKQMWYDRDLCFMANSLPDEAFKEGRGVKLEDLNVANGEYQIEVTLKGGSGKASVTSPTKIVVKGGTAVATIEWSSSNYDYMIVGEEKYLPINEEGNSVFEIPVEKFDTEIPVKADTTAMSKPYEIDYTLNFSSTAFDN